MTTTIDRTLETARDGSMAASDERALARMTSDASHDRAAPARNAILQRDLALMKRSEAAVRRFSRTTAGRRRLREV